MGELPWRVQTAQPMACPPRERLGGLEGTSEATAGGMSWASDSTTQAWVRGVQLAPGAGNGV